MAEQSPEVRFVNNPYAPDIFAAGASGYAFIGSNVVITFETFRMDHSSNPGAVERVVLGRLIMPIVGAQQMVLGLHEWLQKKGFDPTKAAQRDQTAQ